MPSIEKVLKSEIQRLARKEAKAATADIRNHSSAHRAAIADLKRRIHTLEKENKQLLKQAAQSIKQEPKPSDDEIGNVRITGKMIKSARKRLALSQAQLGKLVGVTGQTVLQWEHKDGRLSFRGDVRGRLVALRKMTKKEVAEKLAG